MTAALPWTLIAAVVFAAIFLFGGSLRPLGSIAPRRAASLAAGAAVAYVFVHLLPELEAARSALLASAGRFSLPLRERTVGLASMLGFAAFYGLEEIMASSPPAPAGAADSGGDRIAPARWAHVGGFGAYAWLVSYLLVKGPEGRAVPLTLYAVAMGLHFFSMAHALEHWHGRFYDRVGSRVLAAMALGGWLCGALLDLPAPALAGLLGFVAGAVIANTMTAELPREKQGRFGYFLIGIGAYTALLLALDRHSSGGDGE